MSVRTWAKWEGEEGSPNKHRFPSEAHVELFCLKRGLAYPLQFDQRKPEEEVKPEPEKDADAA